MAVSVRQSAFISGDHFNYDIVLPSAPLSGSLLLAMAEHWTNNPTAGSGYTQDVNSNGSNTDITTWYKYAGSGESATQRICSGANQGIGILVELVGVSGSYAADVQSVHSGIDISLSSNAYNTTSFNTGANNVGLVSLLSLVSLTSTTQSTSPTISGGAGNISNLIQTFWNNGTARSGQAAVTSDFAASSGTSISFGVTAGQSGQQAGAYAIYEIKNFQSPAHTVSLGLNSETDSTLALAHAIANTVGLVSETDSALPLSVSRTFALGIASETDSARSFSQDQTIEVGLALEEDSDFAIRRPRFDVCEETDFALPLVWARLIYWPFDDLKPRHIGIYPVAATIGGGVALTNKEPAIDSGNGFWKIEYGSVPLMNRAKILKWREFEAKAEGRGQVFAVPIYDGKRAPWPGAPGGAIDIEANADAAIGDTSLEVLVNDAGTLLVGQHFSADAWLYQIKSVTDLGGGVFTIGIWPKLRAAITAADPLEFRRPLCRVRLETDDAMALDLAHLKFGDPSVTFVEAL